MCFFSWSVLKEGRKEARKGNQRTNEPTNKGTNTGRTKGKEESQGDKFERKKGIYIQNKAAYNVTCALSGFGPREQSV